MKNLIQFLFLLLSAFSIAQTTSEIKSQVRHSIDELRDFVAIPNDANTFSQATKHTSGAIIGSAFIKTITEKGLAGISPFIKSLRPD